MPAAWTDVSLTPSADDPHIDAAPELDAADDAAGLDGLLSTARFVQ